MWLRMLYANPQARVCTNDSLSESFSLGCGTRQGCPLSPGLFALALEPLTILISAERGVKDIVVGPIEEKFSLDVDDALPYLVDASSSPQMTLTLFYHFLSVFFGTRINWHKSVLFPLQPSVPRLDTHTPLQWVDEFTYLGIRVSGKSEDYMEKNIHPLTKQVTAKCVA